ncbi:hypothetical protein DL769_011235 [Monosporascus sp. CRB-8-3]|nr:hypothetical protein DL769_011235 [Monosporascus sp. CRB-8-3]
MLCLLTCPPAYLALQLEIDAAFASGRLSHPAATDAEACALPYLDAVLREAMRLHPSVVSPSKLSPVKPQKKAGGTDTVCGFKVPGGTQVGANVPGVLRSEAAFGPDAACFRPERWLCAAEGTEGDRLNRMKTTFDLVFGAGKFMCMGKAIAWMEVRKLFVELMRRFDFAIVDSIKPLHVESLAIMVVHGFNVRVTRKRIKIGQRSHGSPGSAGFCTPDGEVHGTSTQSPVIMKLVTAVSAIPFVAAAASAQSVAVRLIARKECIGATPRILDPLAADRATPVVPTSATTMCVMAVEGYLRSLVETLAVAGPRVTLRLGAGVKELPRRCL